MMTWATSRRAPVRCALSAAKYTRTAAAVAAVDAHQIEIGHGSASRFLSWSRLARALRPVRVAPDEPLRRAVVAQPDVDAAGQAAEQLVGDGAGVGSAMRLDRQAAAPEGDRRRRRPASGWRSRSIASMSIETRPTASAGAAVDQDRRAGAGVARIAVAVADGGDADPRGRPAALQVPA